MPYLEITEVVLVHCKIVNNNYQQNSRVLYTFVPNKKFDQLLDISPKLFTFSKTFPGLPLFFQKKFAQFFSRNEKSSNDIPTLMIEQQNYLSFSQRYTVSNNNHLIRTK